VRILIGLQGVLQHAGIKAVCVLFYLSDGKEAFTAYTPIPR
jgi:hypothetical protein